MILVAYSSALVASSIYAELQRTILDLSDEY